MDIICYNYHDEIKYAKSWSNLKDIFMNYTKDKSFYFKNGYLYISENENKLCELFKYMLSKIICVPKESQSNLHSFQNNLFEPINMNTGIPYIFKESENIIKYEIIQRIFIEFYTDVETFKKILKYCPLKLVALGKLPLFNNNINQIDIEEVEITGPYISKNLELYLKENATGDTNGCIIIDEIFTKRYGFHFESEVKFYDARRLEIWEGELNHYRDYSPGPNRKRAYDPIKRQSDYIHSEENRQKYWKNYEICHVKILHLGPNFDIKEFIILVKNLCNDVAQDYYE